MLAEHDAIRRSPDILPTKSRLRCGRNPRMPAILTALNKTTSVNKSRNHTLPGTVTQLFLSENGKTRSGPPKKVKTITIAFPRQAGRATY